ncbi:hypothetical protein CRUP_022128 [Coryphaenoides rupestris]|nr:hypothetical protein CRUP_022128 [Coryphaenoides rupestris]
MQGGSVKDIQGKSLDQIGGDMEDFAPTPNHPGPPPETGIQGIVTWKNLPLLLINLVTLLKPAFKVTWLISLLCLFNLVILKKLESKVNTFRPRGSAV